MPYCRNCGALIGAKTAICFKCGTKVSQVASLESSLEKRDVTQPEYGGFWIRLFAGCVDLLITFFLLIILLITAENITGIDFGDASAHIWFILIIGYDLYFTASLGQTPGKKVLDLKVVRLDGERITYKIALTRVFWKVIGTSILGLGILWIIGSKKKQGFHDKMVGTIVVRAKTKEKPIQKAVIQPIQVPKKFCRACGNLMPRMAPQCPKCGAQNLVFSKRTYKFQSIAPATAARKKKIEIRRGIDRAGEYLKAGIKVVNDSDFTISHVKVTIDVPDGLKFVQPQVPFMDLGTIEPKSFRSAIFKMKPEGKCIDGILTGIVAYKDARNFQHTLPIKELKLVSICPMLEKDEISRFSFIALLRSGKLKKNKIFVKFKGNTKNAFKIARNRVLTLTVIEEDLCEEKGFITAYACLYGKTKYKNFKFAVEILANGTYTSGNLTMTVYSDEEAILTGFFSEVLDDVKKSLEIFEEKKVEELKCASCGAPIDLEKCDAKGYYKCEYCSTIEKVAAWHGI